LVKINSANGAGIGGRERGRGGEGAPRGGGKAESGTKIKVCRSGNRNQRRYDARRRPESTVPVAENKRPFGLLQGSLVARAAAEDAVAASAKGSIRLLRLADGGAHRAAYSSADRAADHGAGDGAGGGLLFNGLAAGGQRQGGGGEREYGEGSGHLSGSSKEWQRLNVPWMARFPESRTRFRGRPPTIEDNTI